MTAPPPACVGEFTAMSEPDDTSPAATRPPPVAAAPAPPDFASAQSAGDLTPLRLALRMLFPLGALPDAPAGLWRRAAWWFVPLGLVVGLAWAGLFRASWKVFGEAERLRLIPALVVLVLDAAILGYCQYWGVAHVIADGAHHRASNKPDASPGVPVAATLMLVFVPLALFVLLVAVPDSTRQSGWLEGLGLAALVPQPVFRPLILAPMWGHWAVLMAANIGRACPGSTVTGLCEALRPGTVLLSFIPLGVLTAAYCARDGHPLVGVIVALVVFGVTHLLSTVLGRRGGGQTEATLLASGMAAKLTFLLAYVAAVTRH